MARARKEAKKGAAARAPRATHDFLALSVRVPGHAVPLFVAAFEPHAEAVDYFLSRHDPAGNPPETVEDLDAAEWQVAALRRNAPPPALGLALAVAAAASGIAEPALVQARVPAADWLERTRRAFPPQPIGRRFWVQGTHEPGAPPAGRIALALDAGLAFGSGEHATTRGCLMAFERRAPRRPRPLRLLDMGTGSGILALAAAKWLRRRVLACDIERAAVATTRENAARNGVAPLVRAVAGNGWITPAVRKAAPYDLVFANILARPLTRMARALATRLAPGGVAILAGLLASQDRLVLAAHRRHGLVLAQAPVTIGAWRILVVQKPARGAR
ncbi:MAG: 50S ribosomal protein L11 methyltransferase [Alphaproteobacteria bacterium]|nr:50S ribosomal protein L11 methyltransferase [Alphaproteobacteria bacterium]